MSKNTMKSLVRKLATLEKSIMKNMEKGVAGAVTRELAFEYLETVSQLSGEISEEEVALYEERCSELLLHLDVSDPRNKSLTGTLIHETKPAKDLPKERTATHNGQVESFGAFWTMFEKHILARKDVDDEEKWRRLCSAVCEVDCAVVSAMDLVDATTYLEHKYKSSGAVRKYIAERLGKLKVKNIWDIAGLSKLKEDGLLATIVAESCKDKRVLSVAFDAIYNCLPAELALKYWDKAESDQDARKLLKFVQDATANLVSHQSSSKALEIRQTGHSGPTIAKCFF